MRVSILPLTLALAACGSESETIVAEGTDSNSETVATEATFDGGPVVGTYRATSTDGTVLTQTLTEDGAVTSVDGNGNAIEGTYRMGANEFCITNDGDEACYTYSDLREDGSWTATNATDSEDRWIISRVDSAA